MISRKQNRLIGYDYSLPGYYFITICTHERREWFGKIKNGVMELNEYGQIAQALWKEIQEHFKRIKLGEFIVMPNHVHGIIIIGNDVGNRHACSLQAKRQYQVLPVIIGSYKSAVARFLHQIEEGGNFCWQKSFYDHVIRDEQSLHRIREYISHNPAQWDVDIENRKVGNDLKPFPTTRDYYSQIFNSDATM